MMRTILFLSLAMSVLVGCERTERHDPKERVFAALRGTVSAAKYAEHELGKLPVNLDEVIEGVKAWTPENGVHYAVVAVDGEIAPLAYSALVANGQVAVAFQISAGRFQGIISAQQLELALGSKTLLSSWVMDSVRVPPAQSLK